MSFITKSFSGLLGIVFGVILIVLAFWLFVKIVPFIIIALLIVWIIKTIKRKRGTSSAENNVEHINNQNSEDIFDKNIVDVEYTDVN